MPAVVKYKESGEPYMAASDEPPADHLRCETISQYQGRRCFNHKQRGSVHCAYHTKYHDQRARHGKHYKMPRFYSRHVSKSLAEVLDEALEQNPQEQVHVFEELALMRDVAGQAVQYYSIARDLYNDTIANPEATDKQKEARRAILFAAGEIMRERLEAVVSVADTAAKISSSGKDKVAIQQLNFFIQQVTRCAFESFGDDPRAEDFNRRLHETVRIPVMQSDGTSGTALTPDQDVVAMDATIPASIIDIKKVNNKVNGENGHGGFHNGQNGGT